MPGKQRVRAFSSLRPPPAMTVAWAGDRQISCKRLLDINSTSVISAQHSRLVGPGASNVPVTMRLTGFREAYHKGRPLVYRYYPVRPCWLPPAALLRPDVRFRPHGRGGRRHAAVKWRDAPRCNCGDADVRKMQGVAIHSSPTGSRAGMCRNFRIRANSKRVTERHTAVPFALCNGRHRDPVGGDTGALAVLGLPAPRTRAPRGAGSLPPSAAQGSRGRPTGAAAVADSPASGDLARSRVASATSGLP